MKGNDWLISLFLGLVLSMAVIVFIAQRLAGS